MTVASVTDLPPVFDRIESGVFRRLRNAGRDHRQARGLPRADIKGPRAAGMKALHVVELERIMRDGGGR